jgi:hypothetical protein
MKIFVQFLCVMPFSLAAIQLQYSPDVIVEQQHRSVISMEQEIDGKVDSSRMEQLVDLELKLLSIDSMEPVTAPPIHLEMTIRRVRVTLEKEGRETHFDTASNEIQRDPFVARFRRLVGKPIDLTIGDGWQLEGTSKELELLFKQVPSLNNYLSPEFFSGLLKPVVALAGESIETGQVVEKESRLGQNPGLLLPVGYHVTSAGLREIKADISGTHEEEIVPMANGEAHLSGSVTGKASWVRRNALETQTEIYEFYEGKIVQENKEYPLKMSVTQVVQSKRKV